MASGFLSRVPVIRASITDLTNDETMEALRKVCQCWVRFDRDNCELMRQGLLRFRMPQSYIKCPPKGVSEMRQAARSPNRSLKSSHLLLMFLVLLFVAPCRSQSKPTIAAMTQLTGSFADAVNGGEAFRKLGYGIGESVKLAASQVPNLSTAVYMLRQRAKIAYYDMQEKGIRTIPKGDKELDSLVRQALVDLPGKRLEAEQLLQRAKRDRTVSGKTL